MQSFLRNKFVANSVDGLNEYRLIRIVLDFLAQFRNAVVHCAITRALPFWPDGTDKLLARQDHPRPGNQKFEQLELLKSQCNRLVSTTQLHFPEVERELAEFGRLASSAWLQLRHRQKGCGVNQRLRQATVPMSPDLSRNRHILVKTMPSEKPRSDSEFFWDEIGDLNASLGKEVLG